MIGTEGDGFRLAQNWLNIGRIRHGARGIGVIERCLELGHQLRQAARHLRRAACRPPVGAVALADAFMDLHLLRLMVYDAALEIRPRRDIRVEAYMGKIFGDAQSFVAADRCMTSTAASASPPICRSRNSGATSAAS